LAVREGGEKSLELVFGPTGSGSDATRFAFRGNRGGNWRCEMTNDSDGRATLGRGQAVEDFAPAGEGACGRIVPVLLGGTVALSFGDARLVEIDQAGFRTSDEQPIVGEGVAKRTKAVAVQLRADKLAVRENQSRGAVPRFTVLGKRSQCRTNVAREKRI